MEHDLAPQLLRHLDPHLAFAVLEFLRRNAEESGESGENGGQMYSRNAILAAQCQSLAQTNMVDFEADLRRELEGNKEKEAEIPADLAARRVAVLERMAELKKAAEKLVNLVEDSENKPLDVLRAKDAETRQGSFASEAPVQQQSYYSDNTQQQQQQQQQVKGRLTFAALASAHGVTAEDVRALHAYARFQYDCGNYSAAHTYLSVFHEVTDDAELKQSARWGLLASEILQQKWDAAMQSVEALRDWISSGWKRAVPPLQLLQQRTWLIHWSLFVYFNHEAGRNVIVDALFNDDKYLNVIQTTSPHILRYIAAAIVTNRRRKSAAFALVRVLQAEAHEHSDPITEFLVELFVNFNFEAAQAKLDECLPVLRNDFFLKALAEGFRENGQVLVYETYCQIHQKVDISSLTEKLGLKEEEAERWIVDLIRVARMDAKIDSASNAVVMSSQHTNTYQKIIEKTKSVQFRSFNIASNIAKFQRQKEKAAGHSVDLDSDLEDELEV